MAFARQLEVFLLNLCHRLWLSVIDNASWNRFELLMAPKYEKGVASHGTHKWKSASREMFRCRLNPGISAQIKHFDGLEVLTVSATTSNNVDLVTHGATTVLPALCGKIGKYIPLSSIKIQFVSLISRLGALVSGRSSCKDYKFALIVSKREV